MCMSTYYHYTDRDGLKGILRSRTIKKSPSGRYGKGVYLTRLPPRHGREKIAQNNWDGVWQSTELRGKVDYTISVRLPDSKVKKYGEIFLFKEDVDLDMTSFRLYSKHSDHRKLKRKYWKCDDDSSESEEGSSEEESSSEEEESSDDE